MLLKQQVPRDLQTSRAAPSHKPFNGCLEKNLAQLLRHRPSEGKGKSDADRWHQCCLVNDPANNGQRWSTLCMLMQPIPLVSTRREDADAVVNFSGRGSSNHEESQSLSLITRR